MCRFRRIASLMVPLALALVADAAAQPVADAAAQQVATRDAHLAFGNPSNATNDPSRPDNFLIERPQYSLSYNRATGRANWVAWHLSTAWLGNTPRIGRHGFRTPSRVRMDLSSQSIGLDAASRGRRVG